MPFHTGQRVQNLVYFRFTCASRRWVVNIKGCTSNRKQWDPKRRKLFSFSGHISYQLLLCQLGCNFEPTGCVIHSLPYSLVRTWTVVNLKGKHQNIATRTAFYGTFHLTSPTPQLFPLWINVWKSHLTRVSRTPNFRTVSCNLIHVNFCLVHYKEYLLGHFVHKEYLETKFLLFYKIKNDLINYDINVDYLVHVHSTCFLYSQVLVPILNHILTAPIVEQLAKSGLLQIDNVSWDNLITIIRIQERWSKQIHTRSSLLVTSHHSTPHHITSHHSSSLLITPRHFSHFSSLLITPHHSSSLLITSH